MMHIDPSIKADFNDAKAGPITGVPPADYPPKFARDLPGALGTYAAFPSPCMLQVAIPWALLGPGPW